MQTAFILHLSFKPSSIAPQNATVLSFREDSEHRNVQNHRKRIRSPQLSLPVCQWIRIRGEHSSINLSDLLQYDCWRIGTFAVKTNQWLVRKCDGTEWVNLLQQVMRDQAQRWFHGHPSRLVPNTFRSASLRTHPRIRCSPFRKCLQMLVHSSHIRWFYKFKDKLGGKVINLPDSNSRSIVCRWSLLNLSKDVCDSTFAATLRSDYQNFQNIVSHCYFF